MKERTYSEEEISALLERTAELQVATARSAERRPGLTLAELESVAAEAGLDPVLVRQAATELDEPSRTLFDSSTGTTSTHAYVERWVPGALTPEAWEDIVVELRHRYDTDLGKMMGMPAYGASSTEQIGRTVEWRHTNMSGLETRVLIRPRGDGLRIRVSQRLGWASELTESATYGTSLAALAALIVGSASTSVGVAFLALFGVMLAAIPLILYAEDRWRKQKRLELEDLADQVAELAVVPEHPSTSHHIREAILTERHEPPSSLPEAQGEVASKKPSTEWEGDEAALRDPEGKPDQHLPLGSTVQEEKNDPEPLPYRRRSRS